MAADLTGIPLSNVYSGFLHTGGESLSGLPTQVYTGDGQQTSLSVSSTALSVNGSLTVGAVTYPSTSAVAGSIPTLNESGELIFKQISDILTVDPNTPKINGTFSSPTIKFTDSVVTEIISNITTNLFFMPSRATTSRAPAVGNIIQYINWQSPVDGDRAFVAQKIISNISGSRQLNNISFYEFEFISPNWVLTQQY